MAKLSHIQIRFVLGIPTTRKSNKLQFNGAPLVKTGLRSDLHNSVKVGLLEYAPEVRDFSNYFLN